MNTKTLSISLLSSLILLSVVTFAACLPIDRELVLAQSDPVEKIRGMGFDEVDLTSWELDASDISAALQAAHYLVAARQVSGELNENDIADARQAAQYLSNIKSANNMDFYAADLISWELDASDISAARQAAHYLVATRQVSGELDEDDIADARQAAQTLNYIFVTSGVNLKNSAFQRTAAEQEFARRFEAS